MGLVPFFISGDEMKVPKVRDKPDTNKKTVYYLDYYDVDGVRHRPTIGHRKDVAEKVAAKIYSDMVQNKHGLKEPIKSTIGLSDLIERLMMEKENRIKPSSITRYRIYQDHLNVYFKKYFKSIKKASQIEHVHLEEHLKYLKRNGKSNSTINRHIQFIRMLFRFAVAEGLLPKDPSKRLRNFQEQKDKPISFWTADEIKQIINTAPHHWQDHFEFLFYTGLRKGELMNLTWTDVELDRKQSVIKLQASEDWRTKTNRIHTVPLNAKAVEIIERQVHSEVHNYVFKGAKGGQVHRDRIYTALKRTLAKLKLEGDVHKFRHSFASHLVMNGVGIETVSKLLGHTDIQMTMKYAHLAPDYLQQAVDKLKL